MRRLQFKKMHGLGNDFVVLDARLEPIHLSTIDVRHIADRRLGIGCDQLMIIDPPRTAGNAAYLRLYNADGGLVSTCGNASRCAAWLLHQESGERTLTLETAAGPLEAEVLENTHIQIDMGAARFDWRDIPLSQPANPLHLPLTLGPLSDGIALSMGNPHAVFFVPDAEAIALAELGPQVEQNSLFPQRTNVEVVQVLSPTHLRMRVWERGAGITPACGSGACAALVAAFKRGLTGRQADVSLDGGTLHINYLPDGHVLMTGPVAAPFSGELLLG
jgi:diaminopimelate epimerase